jgi:cellulose synthase/poly-beta-1,6-N-acetylglucosamine synthase-like glycosyltransferase/peptidoglycan/xylan/chitin deacetylase (PgdA/CDA1 family)
LTRVGRFGVGLVLGALTVVAVLGWWIDVRLPRPDVDRRVTAGELGPVDRAATATVDGDVIDPQRGGGETALTFTGGPVAGWTDGVLAQLDDAEATATFFFEGSELLRNPALARRTADAGHEIGLTGLQGPDLVSGSDEAATTRLTYAQTALAGVLDLEARLIRPIDLLTPTEIDNEETAVSSALAGAGVVVNADRSTRTPHAEVSPWDLVVDAMPAPGRSSIVEFTRPATGDASGATASLEALDAVLPGVVDRGDQLVPVSSFVGEHIVDDLSAPAEASTRRTGQIALVIVTVADWLRSAWGWSASMLALASITFSVLALIGVLKFSSDRRRRQRADGSIAGNGVLPAITVVIPAHNEADSIERSLASIEASHFPDVEVIVVDDGSTDDTVSIATATNTPGLRVVSIPHSGKAAALNQGLMAASHDIVITTDADTRLEPGTLLALAMTMTDPTLGAASGSVHVEKSRGMLGWLQEIEYAVASGIFRRAFATVDSQTCVPGALGAFRRSALLASGGFPNRTLAEDTDLTVMLQAEGWRVAYEPTARAHTLAPRSIAPLWRQRLRWSGGVLQVISVNRRAWITRTPSAARVRTLCGLMLMFSIAAGVSVPADGLILLGAAFGLLPIATPLVVGLFAAQLLVVAIGLRVERSNLWLVLLAPAYFFFYRPLLCVILIRSAVLLWCRERIRWRRDAGDRNVAADPISKLAPTADDDVSHDATDKALEVTR